MAAFLHAWHADLAAAHPCWPAAEATLAPAELARQARLRTPALRQSYGRAHGFLRGVISQYTGQPASSLCFETDANGKPTLAGSHLQFNLSYRPGRALLALSDAGAVGADVEPLAPLPDAAALIAELFSGAEQAALRAAAPADYWPLFYTIWTRKEAYAKALGMGLALPFAGFSVLDFRPGQPPGLCALAGAQLLSFGVGGVYQGAVALLHAPPLALQLHEFGADLARV